MAVKKMTPEKIKKIRLELGLTQKELAEILGYSHKVRITEIEKGRRVPHNSVFRLLEFLEDGIIPIRKDV